MDSNKILLEVYIPSIEKSYDIFVPINKKIGTVKALIEKGVMEFVGDEYQMKEDTNLYSKVSGLIYDADQKVVDTDLRNGSRIILI